MNELRLAWPVLRRLLGYARPHRGLLARAFLAMAILGITTGAYAYLMGPAIKLLLTGSAQVPLPHKLELLQRWLGPTTLSWTLPVLAVVLGLFKGFAYLGQFYWMGQFGQRVAGEVRRALFTRLIWSSPIELGTRRVGDLLSRFGADVAAIEVAATYSVASYVRDGLQLLLLFAVALTMSWKLTLLSLGLLPLALAAASRFTRSVLRRTREGQEGLGELAAQLHEGIAGLRTVQAFNAEARALRRFDRTAAFHLRAVRTANWARGAVPALMEVSAAGGLALVLGFTASSGTIAPERLISFLAALLLAWQPAKDLGRMTQFALQAKVAGDRIFELLDRRPLVDERLAAPAAPALRQAIELVDVHASYGERSALRGVSLELPVGEVTALVGESGGGKSTVAALLLGFMQPTQGQLLLDGVELERYSAPSVRARMALVTQESLLFAGSVRENLRLGRPGATDEELWRALRIAGAAEVVEGMAQGLETLLGERGARLSGGQRQRLCLARALLADPELLILDEATSNLDPRSEREVRASIAAILPGRTALVIAHRLVTIQTADRIHVLVAGQVVERGTHDELLARGGEYARLWRLQHASPEAHVA